MSAVRALLLDAGLTLVGPSTGNWFVPPGWKEWFRERVDEVRPAEEVRAAFESAFAHLDARPLVPDVAAELSLFEEFFRRWLGALGIGEEADYRGMAKSIVLDPAKFLVYADVPDSLARLSSRYGLAVVSDTWPSLDPAFRHFGIRDPFGAFVMSSELGCCKPDPRMYRAALDGLGASAAEAVFVDDSVRCLEGAAALGIRGVRIDRASQPGSALPAASHDSRWPVVRDLRELETLLEGPNYS